MGALIARTNREQPDATALRDAVGHPSATPVERGLIEAVAQAWLVHEIRQLGYARRRRTIEAGGAGTSGPAKCETRALAVPV